MGMFSGYENLDDQYIPNNLRPCPIVPPTCEPCPSLKPCKPNLPYEEYNMQGELVGYWWYQGDTVNLEFNISGEVVVEGSQTYITAEDFLQDKQITVKLYNFRREIIAQQTYPGNTTITFSIDDKLAKELVQGVYYTTLEVWSWDVFNKTLIKQEQCTLTIK